MKKQERLERLCARMKAKYQPVIVAPADANSARQIAHGDLRGLTVKEVAGRLRRSVDWVRRHFAAVEGVIELPGPHRGRRPWVTLLIPEKVVERELRRFLHRSALRAGDIDSARQIAYGLGNGLTMKEVAERLRRSTDWVGKRFRGVEGVLRLPGPGRGVGGRSRGTLLIPEDILEHELAKFVALGKRHRRSKNVI